MTTQEQIDGIKNTLNHYARLTNPPAARETFGAHEKLVLMTLGVYNTPQDPWIGMTELCKIYGFSPSYASQVLSGLESRGLLEKTVHPNDRRRTIVLLSEQGRKASEGLIRYLSDMAKDFPIDAREHTPLFLF